MELNFQDQAGAAKAAHPAVSRDDRRAASRLGRSQRNRANGIRPGRSKHVLHLNIPAFDAFMARQGRDTYEAMAEYLSLGAATIFNARQGRAVSDAFVSALLKRLAGTDTQLEDLVIAGETSQVAA